MDLQTEKMIEAMIEQVVDEMGLSSYVKCYALSRFREMLMGMKEANSSEILRQIGYTRKMFDPVACERCGKCSTRR